MSQPVIAIVTGSRDWTDVEAVQAAINALPPGSFVFHGAARGADRLADLAARRRGLHVTPFVARWPKHADGWCKCKEPKPRYCPVAGIIRNRAMRDAAMVDADRMAIRVICLAFPLPQSVGTLDMIKLCEAEGWEVRRG